MQIESVHVQSQFPQSMNVDQIKMAIFYGSWLAPPAAVILGFVTAKSAGRRRKIAAVALFATLLFVYARFIEPKLFFAARHETMLERCFADRGGFKLAVFSDIHIGTYPNVTPVARIAAAVNEADPDAVFIAGDFTAKLAPAKFAESFAVLADIKAPVYAVMGNHDVGMPGADVQDPLTVALEALGVNVINNKKVPTRINGADVEIVGLSDLWEGKQEKSLMDGDSDAPRIVLTHNPSTVGTVKRPEQNVDLMLAGHTHGGQVYIPLFTCLFTDACQTIRAGFKEAPRGRVFVTTGTGMSVLPLRLNVPPRIDVIDVSWRQCPGAA